MPAEDAARALGTVAGRFKRTVPQAEPYPSGGLIQDHPFGVRRIPAQRVDVASEGNLGPFLSSLQLKAISDRNQEGGVGVIPMGHYIIPGKSKARILAGDPG
jgi:hypothetical protein